MNVYDEEAYPLLAGEKQLIKRAIRGDKAVLGTCLGSQQIDGGTVIAPRRAFYSALLSNVSSM